MVQYRKIGHFDTKKANIAVFRVDCPLSVNFHQDFCDNCIRAKVQFKRFEVEYTPDFGLNSNLKQGVTPLV